MIRLQPGDTFYCGYHEWLVHPDEATVILERGHVTINGVACAARQVDTVAGYPLIQVWGLNEYGAASDPQAPALDQVGRRLRVAA